MRRVQVKSLGTLGNILVVLNPVALPSAITKFMNNKDLYYGMVLSIIVWGTIYYPYQKIMYNIKNNELDKLRYFQYYEEELKDIYKLDDGQLANFKKKTVKKIQEETQGNRPLNINGTDNFSLSELKQMREYLENTRVEEGPVRRRGLEG